MNNHKPPVTLYIAAANDSFRGAWGIVAMQDGVLFRHLETKKFDVHYDPFRFRGLLVEAARSAIFLGWTMGPSGSIVVPNLKKFPESSMLDLAIKATSNRFPLVQAEVDDIWWIHVNEMVLTAIGVTARKEEGANVIQR